MTRLFKIRPDLSHYEAIHAAERFTLCATALLEDVEKRHHASPQQLLAGIYLLQLSTLLLGGVE